MKGVWKKMLTTLAKRIAPVLVTVCMVFELLPGGSLGINLNAVTPGDSGTFQFAATAVNVDEAAGSVTLTVTRTGGSGEVTIYYDTLNILGGGAVAGSDYTEKHGTLIFTDGETSKDIEITLADDTTPEAAEAFMVVLTLMSPAGGAALGMNNPATVTIHDYAHSITVAGARGATTVLNGGALQMYATVSPVDANQEVTWSVINGTGVADIGIDGLLSAFRAGTVTVKATSRSEPLKSGTFNVTVVPNVESFQFSPAAYSINENGGVVTLTVTRIGGSDGGVTLDYVTANGTATAGTDYMASAGRITFAAGETSQRISVPIVDDAVHESNETFSVTLSNISSGIISTPTATVAIVDNDSFTVTRVRVSPSSTSVRKGESKTFTATVTGTGNPSQAVLWSIAGNKKSSTSISSSGKLRIANNETARTITVRATSVADHSEYGTAKVTVTARSSDDDDDDYDDDDDDDYDDDDDDYDYDDIEITDSDSDVSYDLTRLSLPSGVSSISVGSRQVSGTVINSDIKNLAQRIGTVGGVRVYDLSLLDEDDDEISDFSGRIRVRLPVPYSYSGDLRVYRYNEFSETLTDMDTVKSGGYLVFDTSRLGYFAIIQYTGTTRPAIPETGARRPPFIPIAAAALVAAFGIALYRAKRRSV